MREIRPHRAVSSRFLSRATARLLDEIDETGNAVGIVRFGRVVAVLAPFDDSHPIGLPDNPSEPNIDEFRLKVGDREILDLITADSSQRWSPDQKPDERSIPDVLGALTRLELAGLVESTFGGFRATGLGRAVRR